MPELPEVETMRRGVLGLVGGRIETFEQLPCERRPIGITPSARKLRTTLTGRTIERIDRLGKRVLLVLDDQSRLMFEPRMTGLVLISDPPTIEHLRVRLAIGGAPHKELLYWDRRGLGSVRWFSEKEFQQEFHLGRLGPDALDIEAAEFREKFATTRQPIKVALLDQKRVAGIGNLYASEILHQAKIDPAQACHELKPKDWKRIHACMREILLEAIAYEGSTLNDGTYRNALNQSGSYQNHHRVYAKEGEVCRSCGKATIIRTVQAQRATFFCPRCQKSK
ncbi:bifunctional DNA-formamidopyrimidine glycosylase/DNA-(apurinic or apyrimidinic site) lyase [Bremerella cremea]|uniref:Formamidopyrimidine-DNA glycosylase n=1 Tax=Bremerella cremea TaxID=1031537 RepID=A0A368KK50_9BACT|nr:bifunctional DNA-formamidopyrimidine glycosylase/DNA-(apurinic or apyrimidinic site) lyase [Bremerella cremea]RCS41146.1 bifunctional DNA-formamidopyrimidine glycosylase/DNA-(apurinic or apyrimidinic site) lyase [Bremerella cremea]